MNFDKVNIIASIILIVIASIAYYPVVMVYADEIQEETQVTDKVELEVVSEEDTKEELVVVEKKLTHRVSITGNFDGEHRHLEIDENKEDLMSFGNGQMSIGSKNFDFILRGEFFRVGIDPLNPICDKIFGLLTIVDEDVQLNLELFGKNCRYGMTSYTFGTFIVYKTEGVDYEDGTGRFTMITDERLTEKNTHDFYGQLQGSMTN